MQVYERYLTRWHTAGLVDEITAAAIRQYEQTEAMPKGRRWLVVLALVLGGILLGAGILLFVAAHWDQISPTSRVVLVMAMLAIFHGAGIAASDRFPGFSTTMHALGTVSCGAAIALIGQIFNMQEHWPAAILLWALCALAGWWLIGDEFQQTLALLLVPAWTISEWSYRADLYNGSFIFADRMIAVIAAAYLISFLHSRRRVVFGILFGLSAVALVVCTGTLSTGWHWFSFGHDWGFVPLSLRLVAYAVMLAAIGFAFLLHRRTLLPMLVVTAMVLAVPWLQTVVVGPNESAHFEPMALMYVIVAAVCVFLAWWGVQQASNIVVNYAVVAFALTVMWFYFSSIMDKLDRSLGLIVLGMLFLGGGWALEKTRRRLVAHIREVTA